MCKEKNKEFGMGNKSKQTKEKASGCEASPEVKNMEEKAN